MYMYVCTHRYKIDTVGNNNSRWSSDHLIINWIAVSTCCVRPRITCHEVARVTSCLLWETYLLTNSITSHSIIFSPLLAHWPVTGSMGFLVFRILFRNFLRNFRNIYSVYFGNKLRRYWYKIILLLCNIHDATSYTKRKS